MDLQMYDMEIIHIPGKQNQVADYWSRAHVRAVREEPEEGIQRIEDISVRARTAFYKVHNAIKGHFGLEKTREQIKADGLWEEFGGTDSEREELIKRLLQGCIVCQDTVRDRTPAVVYGTTAVNSVFEEISMDYMGPFPGSLGLAYSLDWGSNYAHCRRAIREELTDHDELYREQTQLVDQVNGKSLKERLEDQVSNDASPVMRRKLVDLGLLYAEVFDRKIARLRQTF